MEDIEVAFMILNGSAFHEYEDKQFSDNSPSAESGTISLNSWKSLSEQSQSLIFLILNKPSEISGIYTDTGRLSKDAKYNIEIWLAEKYGIAECKRIMIEILEFVCDPNFYFDYRFTAPPPAKRSISKIRVKRKKKYSN